MSHASCALHLYYRALERMLPRRFPPAPVPPDQAEAHARFKARAPKTRLFASSGAAGGDAASAASAAESAAAAAAVTRALASLDLHEALLTVACALVARVNGVKEMEEQQQQDDDDRAAPAASGTTKAGGEEEEEREGGRGNATTTKDDHDAADDELALWVVRALGREHCGVSTWKAAVCMRECLSAAAAAEPPLPSPAPGEPPAPSPPPAAPSSVARFLERLEQRMLDRGGLALGSTFYELASVMPEEEGDGGGVAEGPGQPLFSQPQQPQLQPPPPASGGGGVCCPLTGGGFWFDAGDPTLLREFMGAYARRAMSLTKALCKRVLPAEEGGGGGGGASATAAAAQQQFSLEARRALDFALSLRPELAFGHHAVVPAACAVYVCGKVHCKDGGSSKAGGDGQDEAATAQGATSASAVARALRRACGGGSNSSGPTFAHILRAAEAVLGRAVAREAFASAELDVVVRLAGPGGGRTGQQQQPEQGESGEWPPPAPPLPLLRAELGTARDYYNRRFLPAVKAHVRRAMQGDMSGTAAAAQAEQAEQAAAATAAAAAAAAAQAAEASAAVADEEPPSAFSPPLSGKGASSPRHRHALRTPLLDVVPDSPPPGSVGAGAASSAAAAKASPLPLPPRSPVPPPLAHTDDQADKENMGVPSAARTTLSAVRRRNGGGGGGSPFVTHVVPPSPAGEAARGRGAAPAVAGVRGVGARQQQQRQQQEQPAAVGSGGSGDGGGSDWGALVKHQRRRAEQELGQEKGQQPQQQQGEVETAEAAAAPPAADAAPPGPKRRRTLGPARPQRLGAGLLLTSATAPPAVPSAVAAKSPLSRMR
jgi:hypothetical protein